MVPSWTNCEAQRGAEKVHVDASVLVPLFLNEPHSLAAASGCAREKIELVAAAWCVPEFASAVGIQQRTGAIDAQPAQAVWQRFERMVASDLRRLPVASAHFFRSAEWVLNAASTLQAGNALHLACAEAAGVNRMATLDEVLERPAVRLRLARVCRIQGDHSGRCDSVTCLVMLNGSLVHAPYRQTGDEAERWHLASATECFSDQTCRGSVQRSLRAR